MLQYEGTPISIDPTRAAPNSGAIPVEPAPAPTQSAPMQPTAGGFARPAPESRQTNAIEELYCKYQNHYLIKSKNINNEINYLPITPYMGEFPLGITLFYGPSEYGDTERNCSITIEELLHHPDTLINYTVIRKGYGIVEEGIEKPSGKNQNQFYCGEFDHIYWYYLKVLLIGPCTNCMSCPPGYKYPFHYSSRWIWHFEQTWMGGFAGYYPYYYKNSKVPVKLIYPVSRNCERCKSVFDIPHEREFGYDRRRQFDQSISKFAVSKGPFP